MHVGLLHPKVKVSFEFSMLPRTYLVLKRFIIYLYLKGFSAFITHLQSISVRPVFIGNKTVLIVKINAVLINTVTLTDVVYDLMDIYSCCV